MIRIFGFADVHKKGGQWTAKAIVQMNGPFKGSGDIQTVIINDDFGYEILARISTAYSFQPPKNWICG